MYDDLVDYHGFTGSYSTVKVIYRGVKGKHREVFVPRESEPGEYVEFDFGYIKARYKGEEVELSMHCYQLIYSNDIFVYVSDSERQEALFYSHKLAFEYFDGVSHKVRYDNLKQAVKRVLRKCRKITWTNVQRVL
jgi:transposase